MAESNSRWPAYARVPPFLPVPLRARLRFATPEDGPLGHVFRQHVPDHALGEPFPNLWPFSAPRDHVRL
jgi:hypothetical protein